MTSAPYLTALIAIFARAVVFHSDEACPPRRIFIVATAAAVTTALLFEHPLSALACTTLPLLLAAWTETWSRRGFWRLLFFVAVMLPFLLPSERLTPIREPVLETWHWLQQRPSGAFGKLQAKFVLVHAAGLLLCLSDGNLLIRWLLGLLGITPPPANDASKPQLRSGLVGAVERLVIYIFAANAAFNAIAFVITVKGIVRYQDIMRDHSAEYVLIGTLLSTLFAMLLGMLAVRVI